MPTLIPMLAQTVWHFWLGVALLGAAVTVVVAILALYFVRVTRTRYPQR